VADDEKKVPWICNCGQGEEEAVALLTEFLEVFAEYDSHDQPYLNLDKCQAFTEAHGYGTWHLLFCCLEKMGLCQHHNSISSSAFLTATGDDLRETLRPPATLELFGVAGRGATKVVWSRPVRMGQIDVSESGREVDIDHSYSASAVWVVNDKDHWVPEER
jgi:hypothetical protein